MHYTRQDLERHIKEEHKQSPFGTYLREIVYGGNDGIVTTFAVVAGFAGASAGGQISGLGFAAVLLFGLANLFADGASMSLGNFLSIRSEQDRYRKEERKEKREVDANPHIEKAESQEILKQKGMKGLAERNLAHCRLFYQVYPQVGHSLHDEFLPKPILQLLTAKSENKEKSTPIEVTTELLINRLSFTHIVELIKEEEDIKRTFYEIQA